MKRRKFLKAASAAGFTLVASPGFPAWLSTRGDTVRVAVMGLNGRGTVLARTFARAAYAEVAYVCDVDSLVLAKGVSAVASAQSKAPKGLGDFRKALEDKDVDALVIAAPDHWHTPAALLAMQAGKHVYVEKPCGHNAREGELLVEAQRDRKSTRLNSSHSSISYAVFCLKKKKSAMANAHTPLIFPWSIPPATPS